ncbi:MAG: hypothetical protein AAF478_10740 [Pseudomonadota bacterium]
MRILCIIATAVVFVPLMVSFVLATDRHAGYYYPTPESEETYRAPLPQLPGVSRLSRVGFVTQLDQLQKQKPYPPTYHMFAKGGDAEKLIIVSTEAGRYDTLFRLRGLLASMTADARTSPLFAKLGHVEQLNFFDLLRMAGFKQLTISNGADVAHRVYFE